MRESGAAEGEDGRADRRVGDDLNAEDIGEARAHVLAEGAQDEQLALLVEEEDAGEHLDGIEGGNGMERGEVGRIDPYAIMCRSIESRISRIAVVVVVVVIERDVNRRGEAGRCLERDRELFSPAESM